MTEYRRFDANDWNAFAGAERFDNGDEPLIYEQELNNGRVHLVVVADKNGLQLSMLSCNDENTEENTWMKEVKLTSLRAEGELRQVIIYVKNFIYAPDLAYDIDHPYGVFAIEGFKFC